MKKRLTSKVVWLAVIAQVCLLVAMFSDIIADEIKIIGTCIVEILTLFGILNNPNDKEHF